MGELCDQIAKKKKELESLEVDYDNLNSKKQPTTKELYAGIEGYVTVLTKGRCKYEYILGGDGRSQPYSETREGNVSYITVNPQIYLDNVQRSIIIEYVSRCYIQDHIEFTN